MSPSPASSGTSKNLAKALANLSRSSLVGASMSSEECVMSLVTSDRSLADGLGFFFVLDVVFPFRTHTNRSSGSLHSFFLPHVKALRLLLLIKLRADSPSPARDSDRSRLGSRGRRETILRLKLVTLKVEALDRVSPGKLPSPSISSDMHLTYRSVDLPF